MDIPFQMGVCNKTATALLLGLYEEGVINEKQFNAAKQYSIVISKKGMLGLWWDRLWKKDSDSYKIMIVKVLTEIDDYGDSGNGGDNKNPKPGSPVKSGDFKPASLN